MEFVEIINKYKEVCKKNECDTCILNHLSTDNCHELLEDSPELFEEYVLMECDDE